MLRHAYLIMAHSEYEQLGLLLQMLDFPGNDIYLHIDKKSNEPNVDELLKDVRYSQVYIYQEFKVYWGDFSQTACEVFLLEKAYEGKYDYYHLLSGADLPLCSQKKIQSFFEENYGKEYVRYWGEEFPEGCKVWIETYHPLQRYLRISKNHFVNSCFERIDKILEVIQKMCGINRLKNEEKVFQKGATWFSITNNLVCEIIKSKEWIYNTFKNTRSSDEIFIQTILKNSRLDINRAETGYEIEGLAGLRYIDWERGTPYVFKSLDFEELMSCGYLFARKFSIKQDEEIVKRLFNIIRSENEEELENRK